MTDRCPAMLSDRFNTLYFDAEREAVQLLDRRCYPFSTEFVSCRTLEETARAIESMVVQGGPPLAYAAGLGLVLHALQGAARPVAEQRARMQEAGRRLAATRPTADDLHHVLRDALRAGEAALDSGAAAGTAVLDYVNSEIERGNQVSRRCGRHAADLLRDGDRILTHCIAGAALAWMLWLAKRQGKALHLFATETRPYLQGARLTTATARELDVPCTLITDAMPAFLMQQGRVDRFICAADRIALDGHISNKVGTYQIALAARRHGVPFHVLGYDGPDADTQSGDDIPIEERAADELFIARGVDPESGAQARVRITVNGVDGYYPAFDITPPDFITAIVTDRGVFPPDEIGSYFL
ncbi:MAG TPA: s-methyl-5-thioribose-1-phosphate isomerase [Anaerolineales bacterium]|jgi:methylthioribose-1-phosphate isomerase|nr:s-methyl-5-thioribose-1-phosphate isomerase [Anaerolineales bacterium]